jgi:pimeloyl-ACP methyl ester carboxylesterase
MTMNFTYKQTPIYYSCIGAGEPLILIHGFLENKNMWATLQGELSKNYRVLAIDLPGHGETEAIGHIHTMEDYAELLLALIQFENIQKVSLIGHSMGGYVALALAELCLQRANLGNQSTQASSEEINKILLLNSTPLADSKIRKQERNRAIGMIQKYPQAFVTMAVKHLFLPQDQDRFSSEIDTAILEAKSCSQKGIINTLKGLRDRKERIDVLKKMNSRCLIILGALDKLIDIDTTKAVAQATRTKVEILPGGHMSYIEHPNKLLHTFEKFLSQ